MRDLPTNWAEATLGQLSTEPEQVVPADGETIRYIDIGSIDRSKKQIVKPQTLLGEDAPSRARKRVSTGDTLVSMTRPNLNAVALVPEELHGEIASTGFDVLRPRAGVDPRWLAYLVRTDEFISSMSSLVQGALYPAIRSKDVRSFVAPIAPSEEQARIADQLDTLLARIRSCNDHLEAIPALLQRFRRAVLDSATATQQYHTAPAADHSTWSDSTIGAIAVSLRYGTSKKCDYAPGTTGVLRIPNIAESGRIDTRDLKGARFDQDEIAKLSLEVGDLLVIRSNGSVELVGKTGLVTGKEAGLLFAGYLMRLRVNRKQALPEFVQLWLSAPAQREYIERTAKSTSGVNNLNADELRSLPVRLPPIDEQKEIVRQVRSSLAFADRVQAHYDAAVSRAARLTPLVLAKAFRGDLVPQDPNDEPASELLARISAQRSQAPALTHARRLRPPRAPQETHAMTKSRHDDDVMGQPYLAEHLRRLGTPTSAEALFKVAELPVADFYKQLAWEVAHGHVKDRQTVLEPGDAA